MNKSNKKVTKKVKILKGEKKMKKFVTAIGAVALALFVTACTPTPDEPPAVTQPAVTQPPATDPPTVAVETEPAEWVLNDGQPATLTVSWWGNDTRHAAMEAALDIFEARYPHITIERDYGVWAGWFDRTVMQLAAEQEADIMQVNYAWIHSFGRDSNQFLDLNTVSHILDLSEWTTDMLNFMSVHGEVAAVPHGMNGRVMIYNRLMLEEFGLTEFPRTVEDLIAYGELVAANNSAVDMADTNRYAFLNIGPETLDIVLLTLLYNSTGRIMQENGQMLHTLEEVQAAFDLIGRMTDSNTLPTIHQQDPIQNESNPVWTSGRAGAAFEWVGNIFVVGNTFLGGENLDNLGIAPFPGLGGRQATMQRPSLGHAISRNTAYPEVAAYLLNFLYTDEEALLAIGPTLGVPLSRTSAAIAEREGTILGHQLVGLDILTQGQMGEIDPLFEDGDFRQGVRFPVIEAFRLGDIDSETAARRFLEEQQAVLDGLFN
jgi:oligogalacturonide transport system substrate-binding protein